MKSMEIRLNKIQPTNTPSQERLYDLMPIGSVLAFAYHQEEFSLPLGWLACNGDYVPIDEYPKLGNLLQDTYGTEYGTFKLPDLRGQFIRGWSAGSKEVDVGRVFGSLQEDAIQNMSGEVSFGDNVNNTGNLVFGISGIFGQKTPGTVWYQDHDG